MPNPTKDPDLVKRLSELMWKHMTRLAWSDARLLEEMNRINASAKGSLSTIQRYKNGTADSGPTPQVLGLISKSLGFTDGERDWILTGAIEGTVDYQLAKASFSQWQELLSYLHKQSNLAYEVQQRRAAARVALTEEDYERAKAELTEVATALYRPAAYHAERFA